METRLLEKEVQVEAEPLRVICSWCWQSGVLTILSEGTRTDGNGNLLLSHGICAAHAAQELADYRARGGELVTCPFCGHAGPRRLFGYWAKPQGNYVDLLKCPECAHFYGPLEG